ncbi:MAG: isocitrate lyase/phosphoenolpyruvate mutase family protein [Acidobacteriota bacterium]
MTQAEKAASFAAMHVKGDPLILYNAWDAGSAAAVAAAGGRAVATGSWSVAAAQGYPDGQQIPLDLLETIAGRIVASVDVPVTIDFEGAYGVEPDRVAENVRRMAAVGAVGINFEDRVVDGAGLHSPAAQADRIAAIRGVAEGAGVPFFINARTDLFLQERDPDRHGDHLAAAKERAAAYAEAGASGFFVPGLGRADWIAEICEATPLPVNVMKATDEGTTAELASLGVARISYGPRPYRWMLEDFGERCRSALA